MAIAQQTSWAVTLESTTPLQIVNAEQVPDAIVGEPYSFKFESVGGKPIHRWAITDGELPPGLTFADDGLLSGATTAEGVFTFTVTVRDSR